jgi:hypothetical protein
VVLINFHKLVGKTLHCSMPMIVLESISDSLQACINILDQEIAVCVIQGIF